MSVYSGKSKIEFCPLLGNDWQDLADYFDIPLEQRRQFEKGRECQAIWEWLEYRNKLQKLPEALEYIKREDLLSVLQFFELPQPISPDEVNKLKQILKSVNISNEQAREFYEQLYDNSPLPNNEYLQGGLFIFLRPQTSKEYG